jgi:hypothetical protein
MLLFKNDAPLLFNLYEIRKRKVTVTVKLF